MRGMRYGHPRERIPTQNLLGSWIKIQNGAYISDQCWHVTYGWREVKWIKKVLFYLIIQPVGSNQILHNKKNPQKIHHTEAFT
jgi:hypothetical protein